MHNDQRNFEDAELDFAVRISGDSIDLLAGGALAIRAGAAEFASVTVGEALRLLVSRYEAGGCQW